MRICVALCLCVYCFDISSANRDWLEVFLQQEWKLQDCNKCDTALELRCELVTALEILTLTSATCLRHQMYAGSHAW